MCGIEHALFFEKNTFRFAQLHTSYFRGNAQVMFLQFFFCIEIANFTWDAKVGELLWVPGHPELQNEAVSKQTNTSDITDSKASVCAGRRKKKANNQFSICVKRDFAAWYARIFQLIETNEPPTETRQRFL